jgi:hypothetical protein
MDSPLPKPLLKGYQTLDARFDSRTCIAEECENQYAASLRQIGRTAVSGDRYETG